ncbi:hypothetical protein [Eleftheria terrae]|uniref:hypothetical protein n=1 Tax=Eleftheria terrae TaxID=1597781 RepID=UPI00263BA21F|nr:hypothetical protein [Eleftheria terrae]
MQAGIERHWHALQIEAHAAVDKLDPAVLREGEIGFPDPEDVLWGRAGLLAHG